MSATTGNLSTRPSATPSTKFIHVSEIREAFDRARAEAVPALFHCDSGAFDVTANDLLEQLSPVDLEDVLNVMAEVSTTEVQNGEWYDLSDVEVDAETAFDSFTDDYGYVDYPIYNADIERIYRENDDEVEEAFSELIAMDSVDDTLVGTIARAVSLAVETAYRVDMAELARKFEDELERAETVEATDY